MPFDSPDINLGDLLKDVHVGRTQLPDFQRPWKWDTDRIQSLLESISLGYPVGVVMMLELGGDDVRFQPRVVSGVPDPPEAEPTQLILDGQQRLTSLYQSLFSHHVVDTADTRGKKLHRWYYLDIEKSLDVNGDREEAIVAVPEDKKLRSNFDRDIDADYSAVELECEAGMFPLALTFDSGSIFDWFNRYTSVDPSRGERWNLFYETVLKNFISYTVPVIVLKKDTPKEAVCTVFEKVNTGGVVLNVFELLTATFAADDFRLAEDWKERSARLNTHAVLQALQGVDFLQVISLLASKKRRDAHLASGGEVNTAPGIGCKRKDVLRLELSDYKEWADQVEEALLGVAQFLSNERIFRAKDLPYKTQLVPLAALHVTLGQNAQAHGPAKLVRNWFWCGVFGELYGGSVESRFARDVAEVPIWVESAGDASAEPATVREANFHPARLLTLRTRNSAAYKGVYALLMHGCRDWMFDKTIDLASFFDESIDIHHVFPKAWCTKNKIDAGKRESIVNKTALAASTNRTIGGRAPSAYCATIETHASIPGDVLDEILESHHVDATHIRADDFDAYFNARSKALLALIAEATGKPALEVDGVDEADLFEVEEPEIDEAGESEEAA
jgi:hypothetical protein